MVYNENGNGVYCNSEQAETGVKKIFKGLKILLAKYDVLCYYN